jgi:hypothetical protein
MGRAPEPREEHRDREFIVGVIEDPGYDSNYRSLARHVLRLEARISALEKGAGERAVLRQPDSEFKARIEREVRELLARRETPEYKLAATIAADLFTNGSGQHARRLVLELDGRGMDGGGWSESAVANRICDALLKARSPESPAGEPEA